MKHIIILVLAFSLLLNCACTSLTLLSSAEKPPSIYVKDQVLAKAKEQHREYCNVLTNLGLELLVITSSAKFPDSCFVEDNAVIHGKKAFITRMGVESRRGEELDVENVLKDFFRIKRATAPATIEGGDVIHLPNFLISGVSQRTNELGTKQMQEWFEVPVKTIINPRIVHLKSHMKYLGNNVIITTDEYKNHPYLEGFDLIVIPKEESYSVNCLAINKCVVMSNKFNYAQKEVEDTGFEVISLEMSEFEKCQASLTCLSILF